VFLFSLVLPGSGRAAEASEARLLVGWIDWTMVLAQIWQSRNLEIWSFIPGSRIAEPGVFVVASLELVPAEM
jgi:hypothetical protein